jgi:ribosomal protein S18 acetylase RimI-like enzyme
VIEITAVQDRQAIDIAARLAHEIWRQHYVPIIGREQVDYMVAKFQSPAAIEQQIAQGQEYFLLKLAGTAQGYFAVERQAAQQKLFLSKLYVREAARGQGLARNALDFMESLCRSSGLTCIWLTVNKHNPALGTYGQLGFKNLAAIVTDIGGGYVMDDYRLEKQLRC